jgi:hypothetical protein
MMETASRKRKRFKQSEPLKVRLEQAARKSREAARTARSPKDREALLQAARQYEATAHLDEWLSSPELQSSS